MNYLAVDPGLDGALCLLRPESQAVVDLPTFHDEKLGLRRIDALRLAEILQRLLPAGDRVRICIEAMANGGQDKGRSSFSTVGSQFWTQSALVNTIELLGLEVEEYVPVQKWKGFYSLKGKRGEDASVTQRKVRELVAGLYPGLADALQRQKDHNRAEAALIAHWFRKVRG